MKKMRRILAFYSVTPSVPLAYAVVAAAIYFGLYLAATL